MHTAEQFGQATDHLSRELSTNEIVPFSHASCSRINWSKEIYIEPQQPNLLRRCGDYTGMHRANGRFITYYRFVGSSVPSLLGEFS